MAAGVALGFGAVLNLHFLRKWRFLRVILPNPSTLIRYWQFGRAVMTFPVVFHWWFSKLCMATVLPVCNGGRLWVCLLYLSTILLFWWWRSSLRCCAAFTHSECGLERVGCESIELWSRRSSRSCASDRPIPWIRVFQYCRMAQATLLLSKEPWGAVFPFTILFVAFTVSSARPLDWGYVTEDSLCLAHHVWRNSWNMPEVKSGQPLEFSSSGVPYVWNRCRQMDTNLDGVAWPGFRWYKISQPVSLSAQARYTTWPTWKMSITICWNGHSRAGVMMMGSRGWLGAIVAQVWQFTIKLQMDAFMPGQYTVSLTWASTPWWAACRQCSIFALRDFGMTILPSINTRPLSVLS